MGWLLSESSGMCHNLEYVTLNMFTEGATCPPAGREYDGGTVKIDLFGKFTTLDE